jgi:hypothetical protein
MKKVENKKDFAYLTDSEFDPDKTYVFRSPFGWEFESKVAKELDKTGKPSGYYYTQNPDQQCYKATSVECRLKQSEMKQVK